MRVDLRVEEERTVLVVPELQGGLEVGSSRRKGQVRVLGEELEAEVEDEAEGDVGLESKRSKISVLNTFRGEQFVLGR